MSATGRSDVRDPSDAYVTPAWAVRRLLEAAQLPGGYWCEPSAGDGAIIRAVREIRSDIIWTAVETRPECLNPLHALDLWSVQIDSFTAPRLPLRRERFDCIIGNPPYRSALEFVQRALDLASTVVFLLRLNWLASRARHDWLATHVPSIFVLPDRPSFVDGTSDATDYAWMQWNRGHSVQRITVLATTPPGERRSSPERERGQLSLLESV